MTVAQDVVDGVTNLLSELRTFDHDMVNRTAEAAKRLDTEHKRLSKFREDGYICSITKKIGQREESTVVDNSVQVQMMDCEVQFVSIIETLKFILSKSDFRRDVRTRGTCSQMLESVWDGSRSKNMPLWSTEGLPILLRLYQDDIEVANPLGANSGVYKLTMYYFSILNLPPAYHALLCHQHLVCVAMATDIKALSHNPVCELVTKDVRELEDGFNLGTIRVYGTLVALSGDNLGLNGIIGLVESFSANHYCRFCMMSKDHCQKNHSCSEANRMSRNHAEHKAHTSQKSPDTRNTGVVRPCSLDDIRYFKAIESFTPDIMHDLLEGVMKLEVALVLESLISKAVITLKQLNHLINTFNYGYTDVGNQPRLLRKSTAAKKERPNMINMKQSASGMWCLFRTLPVMIGDYVPSGSKEWELYRLLSEITAFAFRPYHSDESTHYLDYIVEEHHMLFLRLFPGTPLTPKQHNLCHYGEAIRRNGPLPQFSAMRSESKHQIAKNTGALTCNFRNIPVTVARKYQLKNFGDWCSDNIYPENRVSYSKAGHVSSVTLNGCKIAPGCLLIIDDSAFKVSNLAVNAQGQPLVKGHHVNAQWSADLIAYIIKEDEQQNPIICSRNLNSELLSKYPYPISVWRSSSGTKCFVTKYKISLSGKTHDFV